MLTKVRKILYLVFYKLADLPDTVWKDLWYVHFDFLSLHLKILMPVGIANSTISFYTKAGKPQLLVALKSPESQR